MLACLRTRVIESYEILLHVAKWEVLFDTGCRCGFYTVYYAECGHLHSTRPHCCGEGILDTMVVLCHTPAPSTNVRAVKIRGSCRDCRA